MMKYHEPVLLKEVIDFLQVKADGIYVDVTLGGGGYSEAILKAGAQKTKVLGFDRDNEAIEESKERLKKFSDRFESIKSEFSSVGSKLKNLEIGLVDGIVADLGVSSHQFDAGERGFSFSEDAELDMRMDREQEPTARNIINSENAEDLANLFFEFGDERYSRRIARAILRERDKAPIETTGRLAQIVARAIPGGFKKRRIHPATKVFQALRMVVNDEMNELRSLLSTMPDLLTSGGRMIVVSYHSLEDRLVKRGFLELAGTGKYKRITKKPVRPTEDEVEQNRRARSARLRVLERI